MDRLLKSYAARRLFLSTLLVVTCVAVAVSEPAAQTLGISIGPSQSGAVSTNVPRCQRPAVSRERADARVTTRDQLRAALAAGRRVIWVENGAAIDLAIADHRSDAPDYVLRIPPNVTLASGRSPTRLGGLLYFSRRIEEPRFMLSLGACTRVTGLRLRGPSRSTARGYARTKAIEIHGVEDVLVDNNEFSDWPGGGIEVARTPNTYRTARTIRITRNFFHHNQMCGAGYGVVMDGNSESDARGSYAYIDRNVFTYNRHAVAGDGHPGSGYLAEYNLLLSGGRKCYNGFPGDPGYYEQHFDMHGFGPASDENHYGGDAGEFITMRHNTIRGEQKYYVTKTRPAFMLRGTPRERADFYGNVLAHDNRSEAIRVKGARWDADDPTPPLRVWANQYDVDTSNELAVGDFDGDGVDDVFQATGTVWVFSARGQSDWRHLSARSERLSRLLFGDFNGDGKTDVFTQAGNRWLVSYGGTSGWTLLPFGSAIAMSGYRVGDFDGDGKADIFRANGTRWYYSAGGATPWQPLARSGHRAHQLRFADFDGDKSTDVFGLVGGAWSVSYRGQTRWRRLNALISSNLSELVFADFNGDRFADVARQKGADYQVSWSGTSEWGTLHAGALKEQVLPLRLMLLGDFNGDRRADALHYKRFVIGVGERFVMSSRGSLPFTTRSRHEMR
jgi:hypothetical protein